jgi:hypothetical protein
MCLAIPNLQWAAIVHITMPLVAQKCCYLLSTTCICSNTFKIIRYINMAKNTQYLFFILIESDL